MEEKILNNENQITFQSENENQITFLSEIKACSLISIIKKLNKKHLVLYV